MILSTLGGKQIIPCDAVSIYTWFHHNKLDLEGHMYTKAYYYIVTQIGGLNILLNDLFIYKCADTLWKNAMLPPDKHGLNIWVIYNHAMGGWEISVYNSMAMCKAGKRAYNWLGLSDALAACWYS